MGLFFGIRSLMKTTLLFLSLLSFNSMAQVRPCSNEVLTCRLEKEMISGGKFFLAEASATFSGVNEDEPSIEPYECTMRLSMEEAGVIFNVAIGDSDYVANVYALKRENLGKILPGDVAFPVVKNKPFFYRTNHTIFSCKLQ